MVMFIGQMVIDHFNDKYDTHTYEVEQGVPWRYGDVGQDGFSQKYFQL